MTLYRDHYEDTLNYWAIELPESFPDHRAETIITLQIVSTTPDQIVRYGDVIFGFVDNHIVVACEIVDMLTSPGLQAVIHAEEPGQAVVYQVSAVKARVMQVNLGGLYKFEHKLTDADHTLHKSIDKALETGRNKYQLTRGAAWAFDTDIGEETFTNIEITTPPRRRRY